MSVLYVKSSEGFPLLNLKIKSNPLFRAYPTISYLCLLFQLSTLSFSTLFTFLQLYWLSLHLSNITTLFQLISILGPLWQKYFGLFAWHALSSYFCSHVLSLIYFCHSGHNSNILFFRELFPDYLNYSALQTLQFHITYFYFILFRPLNIA